MKKIASVVLNNFENDARVLKEAITLQDNGFNVQVVALHRDGLKLKEEIDDIKVERINLKTKNMSKLFITQLFKYLEFGYKVIKKYKNVDIMHCNDLSPLPIAVFIKLFKNKNLKIVYDAHEYQTERNGLKGIRKLSSRIMEKLFIKKTDHVITVSNSIAEEYKKKYEITKPSVIYNCPFYVEVEKTNIFREKFKINEDQTIYLYQGGLFYGRGLEITLKAFEQLNDSNVLVVIGFGELDKLVKEYAKKNSNIYFHEGVSPNVLLKYTASADVGICLIENTSLSYYYCLPNKLFEYSMVGLPVIVNNLYELSKIVNTYDNGWILKELTEKNIKSLVEEIEKIEDKQFINKKINSKALANDYNWERQEGKLLEIYNNL